MTSMEDSCVNLGVIQRGIEKLPPGVRLVCLPENSLFLNVDQKPLSKDRAFGFQSKEIKELQKIAEDKKLFIHLGGIPWLKDGEVFNEAILITEKGEVKQTYEKIHLFDVNLGGGIEVCESNSYGRGERLCIFNIDGWRIATCICYDLRFPEIFIHYVENEKVDAFVVPAAFTVKTGRMHWKTLLMARAIETQAYILAPAQVGNHRDLGQTKLRKTWGQSLVVSPWGKILKETLSYEQFLDFNSSEHEPIHVVMEASEIANYRKQIPVSSHRRFKMELMKK